MSKILDKAKALSWAKGTAKKKYAYKGGAPTSHFKTAYRKVWGKGVSMKKAANCDRAAATVVRIAGYGKMPSGNKEQLNWKPSKLTRKKYKNKSPYSVSKAGDVIIYQKSNGKRHTLIRGENCLYEAQHQKTYFHRNGSLKKLKAKRPKVVVLREK